MDRGSQIKAIEKTFQDNKTVIDKHYSKPNVVPVEIQPVYPDFKIWKYPCAQVFIIIKNIVFSLCLENIIYLSPCSDPKISRTI